MGKGGVGRVWGGVGRVWVGYEEVGRYEEVGVGFGEVG